MEIDTTAIAIKNGTGKKVIYINKNGPQENQDDLNSVFFKKEKANCKGEHKMYSIMQHESKHP